MARANLIKALGYELVEIYFCELMQKLKTDPGFQCYMENQLPLTSNIYRMSEGSIRERIRDGTLFGFVDCRLKVSPWLHDYFQMFPPIFKHARVEKKDLGAYMQSYLDNNQIDFKAHKALIQSMHADRLIITSCLARYYMEIGVMILEIFEVTEYHPKQCLRDKLLAICDERRQADRDPDLELRGLTAKNLANSAFGSLLISKHKHNVIKYAYDKSSVYKWINNRRFRDVCVLSKDKLYEVTLAPRTLKMDISIHLGSWVLIQSKLALLKFVYTLIMPNVRINYISTILTDTDSILTQLARMTLDECGTMTLTLKNMILGV